MVMALHYEARKHMRVLYDEHRWGVLTMLILHANVSNRCWPSIDGLAHEMGISPTKVSTAKKWLIEHKAVELVPYDKRVGKELKCSNRQHVYQLTGNVEINGQSIPYFFTNPEVNVTDGSNFKPEQFIGEVTDGSVTAINVTGVGNGSIESSSEGKSNQDSKTQSPPTPNITDADVVIDSRLSVLEIVEPKVELENPKVVQSASTATPDEPQRPQGEAISQPVTPAVVSEKALEPQTSSSAAPLIPLPPLAPPGYRWLCSTVSDSRMHLIAKGKSIDKGYPLCKSQVRHRVPWSPHVDKQPCEQCLQIANNMPEPPDLETQLVMFTIARITGLDPRLTPGVAQTARRYRAIGYTADDLIKAQEVCTRTDWRWVDPKRGTPGRKMALDDLTRYLGTARTDTANFKYQPEMQLESIIERVREAGTLAAIDPDWSNAALESGEPVVTEALPPVSGVERSEG